MLERALFKPEAQFDDGWAVEIRAKSLADSLLVYQGDQAKIRAGIAVSRFSAMVGAGMDAPYRRGADWPGWRKQWQRLRDQYFKNADWYVAYAPMGLTLSSPGKPVSAADRSSVRELNDLAAGLQAAVPRGLQQALKIPEPPAAVMLNTAEAGQREKEWRDWLEQWTREIDGLVNQHNTSLQSGADPHLVLAGRELEPALSDIRFSTVTPAESVFPSKYARRKRFESALVRVRKRARPSVQNWDPRSLVA